MKNTKYYEDLPFNIYYTLDGDKVECYNCDKKCPSECADCDYPQEVRNNDPVVSGIYEISEGEFFLKLL